MRLSLFIACVILLMSGVAVAGPTTKPAGDTKPAAGKEPAAGEDFIVSKMRVQEFKPLTFFYAETQTTISQIGPVVTDLIDKLKNTVKEGHVEIKGPLIFVYQGASQDPNKQFTLQVGFSVAPETKELGEFKVRQLDKFRAATVIFSGPVMQVGGAYQQLFTDLFAAGLQPTEETREYYLYWEAPDSPNNVELLQAGVK
jgi:effector-binding domain-containing protein